ncbi:hypothetical protein [Cupriavidus sp. SK-3]|uniref:hypothetical protein n=1 Tax=Cupriavidus sp. SK-3 TaxID=1470558 RepID=UPI00044A854B|nr:hypothetical protein [Cupriavidus sp. SK-3]KDP89482.1 hypothetical protein CF70_031280 [Cupriavidus sp. SK-3]
MARGGFWLVALVIGGVSLVEQVQKYWPVFVSFIILSVLAALYIFVDSFAKEKFQKEQREEELLAKYGEEIAGEILKSHIWVDQTTEQLVDSRGKPYAIDQKFLKSKVREVWKYNPGPRGGCRLRVTIENGRVVSWDRKI